MPIQVSCPACGRVLRVPDDLIGRAVKCPGCMQQFTGSPPAAPALTETFRPAENRHAPSREADETYRARPDDEPRRPARLPRLDDYDDDDDDDFRRPRRRRNLQFVRSRVTGPANGLTAVGVIGIVLAGIQIAAHGFDVGRNPSSAMIVIGSSGFHIALSILILVAAQKMKNLESYGLAKAGAIVAMIPMISPCCLLGLIFGIQALNVLGEPEVRDAFQ